MIIFVFVPNDVFVVSKQFNLLDYECVW